MYKHPLRANRPLVPQPRIISSAKLPRQDASKSPNLHVRLLTNGSTPVLSRLRPKNSVSKTPFSEGTPNLNLKAPKQSVSMHLDEKSAQVRKVIGNIISQAEATQPLRKSSFRSSRVWVHPHERKMRGMWDIYEDVWFGIRFESVVPLLHEFPLPPPKVHSLPSPVEEIKHPVEEVVLEVPEKKPKEYKIRVLSSKIKKIEDDILPCLKCKGKKRKGARISCGHYFCRDCLRDHIQDHIDHMKVPVKCPLTDCGYELERMEIVKHAANSENIMRYFDLNVTDYVNRRPHKMVQCFAPGCKCVIDISKNKNKSIIYCARCKLSYCMACHKPVKKGHSCEDANTAEAMKVPLRQILNVSSPNNA